MKAVIFDKDGVLSETFDLHAKAHLEVLATNGVKATVGDIAKRYGILTSVILKEIMEEHGKPITKEKSEKCCSKNPLPITLTVKRKKRLELNPLFLFWGPNYCSFQVNYATHFGCRL